MNSLVNLALKGLPPIFCRHLSVSVPNKKTHQCKLLVVGGGSGGCTIAAKFARRLRKKHSVIIIEPSAEHYYQPLWTLVGAGACQLATTRRPTAQVLPSKALWLQDRATGIDARKQSVFTECGDEIQYEYIVIAVGLQNDYDKVPGLTEALEDPCSTVSTIYSHRYAEKVYATFQSFTSGDAIFTYPDTPIKCPGAPQKIAYLCDSYFTKTNKRPAAAIMYNTCLPVIFGVKKYADSLLKVVQRKNIVVNYQTVLKAVDHCKFEATFLDKASGREFQQGYSLLHVTPPMKTPAFIHDKLDLVDKEGYLIVDKHTLQHYRYRNMYGVGDCTNTPNSKTAAAIAKQSYVLERNLLATMNKDKPKEQYNGYGACPLVTSYNTCILAEFLYGGEVHETFPFDQSKESRLAYYMKRDMFPFIYWNFMLKGRYHGPEFVRKIVNPCNWN